MTLLEYRNLTHAQQESLLFDQGVYYDSYQTRKYVILCFRIYHFYAEAYYQHENDRMEKIRPSSHIRKQRLPGKQHMKA